MNNLTRFSLLNLPVLCVQNFGGGVEQNTHKSGHHLCCRIDLFLHFTLMNDKKDLTLGHLIIIQP
ncbi:hypothetical protein AAZV13_15G210900 [Glycine max]